MQSFENIHAYFFSACVWIWSDDMEFEFNLIYVLFLFGNHWETSVPAY